MSLHTLKNANKPQARKRVGRGNGNNWGRTCGRGEKGQKSRSGSTIRPHFEGGQIPLFRRLPKRGFKSRNHKAFAIVNIRDLDTAFADGDTVNAESCQDKKLLASKLGAGLKILGDGQLTKKLAVTAAAFSASAKDKIEAAGGSCTVAEAEKTATAADAETEAAE